MQVFPLSTQTWIVGYLTLGVKFCLFILCEGKGEKSHRSPGGLQTKFLYLNSEIMFPNFIIGEGAMAPRSSTLIWKNPMDGGA